MKEQPEQSDNECIHLWSAKERLKECLKCGALKVESPDVPKEDQIKYKAYHLAKELLSDGSEEYKLEQLIKLFIQSGELADLRAERDKLREERNECFETLKRKMADNERLKELIKPFIEMWFDPTSMGHVYQERLKSYLENHA